MSGLYVDQEVTAIAFGGALHIFYVHDGNAQILRHGVFSGSGWVLETIDGAGGSRGETTHSVVGQNGGNIAAGAFTAPGSGATFLFIAYQDNNNGRLRIGWFSVGAVGFFFQEQDGAGGPNGQVNANVGRTAAIVASTNIIRMLYSDDSNGDLREATWDGIASNWLFSTIDGGGVAAATRNVASTIGAVFHGGVFHSFYVDSVSGDLIHGWNTGTWFKASHDSASNYSINAFSACSDGTRVHVFYIDSTNGDLRQSFGTGSSTWTNATIDGNTISGGRVNGTVGPLAVCAPSMSVSGVIRTGVFYGHYDTNNMRIALN